MIVEVSGMRCPSEFTHLALISAAMTLDHELR
jgi:hypothetical protein